MVKVFEGSAITNADCSASQWKYIVLLGTNYNNNGDFDCMYCYDNDGKSEGVIYLGHFNDGVV